MKSLRRTLALSAAASLAVFGFESSVNADSPGRQFLFDLLVGSWEWSTAAPETALNSPAAEGCPIETADGLSLLFASTRAGGVLNNAGNDIWVSDRDSVDSPWQAPKNLGEPVNSPANDFCPTPVHGRSLFFVSDRPADGAGPAPCGGGDMYLSRQSPSGAWSKPALLRCAPDGPNFPGAERSPSLVESRFGTFLFYSSTGFGTGHDIYVSRMDREGNFGPGQIVAALSIAGFDDIMPNVREREDGSFEIVFSSNRPTWGRGFPAFGGQDVYAATARLLPQGWSEPRNLGAAVNTAGV